MILGVYCIKDEKVEFKPPFFSANEKEVSVSFERLCNDPQCPFPAEDTNLYHLGVFDTETGRFETSQEPLLLKSGIDCLKKEDKNGNQD